MKKIKLSFSQLLSTIMVMCWILPLLILGAVISFAYRQNIVEKTHKLLEGELLNDVEFVKLRIDEAVTGIKKLTYDQLVYNDSLQDSWRKYDIGKISETEFTKAADWYISQGFQSNLYRCVSFYTIEKPGKVYYSVRDVQIRSESFRGEVRETALALSEIDDMDSHIKVIDGRIYIMRNMYTINNHKRFGTLVMELETDEVFENVETSDYSEILFYFDDAGNYIAVDSEADTESQRTMPESMTNSIFDTGTVRNYKVDQRYETFIYGEKTGEYGIAAVIITDNNGLYREFHEFLIMLLVLGAGVIPLLLFLLFFVKKHITHPVSRMVAASKTVRGGDIGHQIRGESMPNQEFAYLRDSFNKMSREVKYLFDYTRQEEAARLDAKILALQSQINPHFLNNTLEMMNWQARMAGDVKTSKMIEALSTLLNYSMGREEKRLCSLREELTCVDAYLYIISTRFGSRLTYEKEIEEKLLDVQVPRLILQPILENAVVHGIEKVKRGSIRLSVYKKDNVIALQTTNTGPVMKPEEQARIQSILSGIEEIPAGRGKHVSLGIRNVNQRIQLIYGEEYGLTIVPGESGEVISTIRIPFVAEYSMYREKIIDNILKESDD